MSQKNNDFKETLFYESLKEFWNERGRGARYRLTTIGVPFFKENIKLGNSKLENIKNLKNFLIDNNFCQSIEYEEDKFSFKVVVENCCLKNVRKKYENEGIEILSCPIGNMIMYILELETGLSPELLPIKVEGNICNLAMAKMGTEKVINEE